MLVRPCSLNVPGKKGELRPSDYSLHQGSQTRGPQGPFVRPAMLFGNFQIINIYVAKCLEKGCREISESKLNDTKCGFRPGRSTTDNISLSSKVC